VSELKNAVSRAYDLTVTRAGELNIPILGSVGRSMNRSVVVLGHIAFKSVHGRDRVEQQYGYAFRLCLTVNKWDASGNVGLPCLAASAQMGQIQAYWILQVVGLAGPMISASIPAPYGAERRNLRYRQAGASPHRGGQ
jgi:hypothetical protein